VLDLNDLRVFERVASLRSFAEASRALGMPKSTVSRSVARLEVELGTRLLQRTTRKVVLTEAGDALMERCAAILGQVEETLDYVAGLASTPRGTLRIAASNAFSFNVLSGQLPEFLRLFPEVNIKLDLSGKPADLLAEGLDVAIHVGPMADSGLIAFKIGALSRHLCASPAYLERRGVPADLESLTMYDRIETPGRKGPPRPWIFKRGEETETIDAQPRICVNDALTIRRLIINGAGLGIISGPMCARDVKTGRLVHLFPDWRLDDIDVSIVFPSRRELSPVVRAFVDFVRAESKPEVAWQQGPMSDW